MKARENALDMETDSVIGSIVPLKVDVTKEDILREATEKMGAHLNASERGILAVVNTAGSIFRGRMDSQEVKLNCNNESITEFFFILLFFSFCLCFIKILDT